jgi:hypothetical protein
VTAHIPEREDWLENGLMKAEKFPIGKMRNVARLTTACDETLGYSGSLGGFVT